MREKMIDSFSTTLSRQQAFEQLKNGGRRVEQQAFAVHDLNHVIGTYLPDKLAAVGGFLP